jgi:hypothetical protein
MRWLASYTDLQPRWGKLRVNLRSPTSRASLLSGRNFDLRPKNHPTMSIIHIFFRYLKSNLGSAEQGEKSGMAGRQQGAAQCRAAELLPSLPWRSLKREPVSSKPAVTANLIRVLIKITVLI